MCETHFVVWNQGDSIDFTRHNNHGEALRRSRAMLANRWEGWETQEIVVPAELARRINRQSPGIKMGLSSKFLKLLAMYPDTYDLIDQ